MKKSIVIAVVAAIVLIGFAYLIGLLPQHQPGSSSNARLHPCSPGSPTRTRGDTSAGSTRAWRV